MMRRESGVKVVSVLLGIFFIMGTVPYMVVASGASQENAITMNPGMVVEHSLAVIDVDVEQAEGMGDALPALMASPGAYGPRGLEDLYSDSAINEVAAPVTEVTGLPDDARYTIALNAEYTRASGSTWGSGSGNILSVEIAGEWTASNLVDDGAILRYYDDSTAGYGATASAIDVTNYAADNLLYLDVTADKASWTWADVGNIHPEITFLKIAGPDVGAAINIDALWIRVQYSPGIQAQFTIPVGVGWNLISAPQIQSDTAIGSVLDDDGGDTLWDYSQYYNSVDISDHWKSYNTAYPGIQDLNDVDETMGIWVRISDVGSDGELTVVGTPPISTDIFLKAGWNLVGYPCFEEKTVADALAAIPYEAVECFDGGAQYKTASMLDSELMAPGNGYWIKVTSDCTWTVGDTTPPTFAGLVSATDAGTGGTIDLMWNPATDPSYPITYNIYMATTSGGQNFATPDFTTENTVFQITGLTNGQEYFFVVRAEDSAGNEDTNLVEKSAIPTVLDVVNPNIILTNPADGSIDVAVGQDVVITFSEPMNTGTVTYTCVPDPGGWGGVWSGGDTVLTLTHNNFVDNTLHTFTITAGEDLAGNPLAAGPVPNPFTFTTVDIDTISPEILVTAPVDGTIDVAVGQDIVITFSEAMNTGTVTYTCGPNPGGWAEVWSGGDTILTLTHVDFAAATLYTFTVTAGDDLAGNPLAAGPVPNPWTFTTIAAATPPQVVEPTAPFNGETNVLITTAIQIPFTEPMDQASVESYFSISPAVAGSFSWNAPGDVLTFTPTADLAYDTVYTITIDGLAEDLQAETLDGDYDGTSEGSPLDDYSFSFTIEIALTPPQVIEPTAPLNGETNVLITTNIQITFTEAMDEASVEAAFSIGPAVAGTFSWNPGSTILTFTPSADLAYGTLYTITIDGVAQDQQGETLDGDYDGTSEGSPTDDYSFGFTTEAAPDTEGPVTSGVSVSPNPTAGAVTVTLTATIDDSTTGGSDITEVEYFVDSVGSDGSGTPMTASDGAFNSPTEGVTVDIDVSGWAVGTYTLYVHGRDAAGNWGVVGSVVLDVTDTTDTIPPQVVSNVPADGATGVAISSNIIVTFTEEMDQANTEGAFGIVPAVAGTFSWNPGGDVLTFNPSADLAWATTYTITILTAATDLAGNTLDGDKDGVMEGDNKDKWVFSFTTENEPDLTGPIVSNIQGTPDPVNSGSPLTLTADVDDSTTGGSNIAEAEWSEGASAANAGAGTSMAASDGTYDSVAEAVTATVDTTGWPDGTATLWVRGRDSQGNWGDAVSTSVGVIGPDLIPPQVVSNVPADGATAVSVSTNIVVTFTEEMDQANTEGAFGIVPAAAGTFSWNAGGDVLTFNPSSDLLGGETYTVTILTAATDLAGNTLDGDKDGVMEADNKDKWVFGFTTEGGGPGAKYAVCVGINKYDYIGDLTYCVNDANECKNILNGDGYSVDILTDGAASKTGIITALNDMGTSEVAGDYTAFTYSGHGGIISGKCVICPADGYDLSTYIQKAELETIFSSYDSTHILIFFDSCNSGGMSTLGSAGRLCIMAAASNQYSWDGQPDIANGVWTYFFWEDGYSDGSAGSLVMEVVFVYAKPLAKDYVDTNYPPYTMDAQISDGYTGDFYL